jgi:hypothetical protein
MLHAVISTVEMSARVPPPPPMSPEATADTANAPLPSRSVTRCVPESRVMPSPRRFAEPTIAPLVNRLQEIIRDQLSGLGFAR